MNVIQKLKDYLTRKKENKLCKKREEPGGWKNLFQIPGSICISR